MYDSESDKKKSCLLSPNDPCFPKRRSRADVHSVVGRLVLGGFRDGGVEQQSDGAAQSVIDLQTGRGQCINGPEQKHTPGRMHTC